MSVKLEVGEMLLIARAIGSPEKFFAEHPKIGAKFWKCVVDRTDLHTSHNRMKSGPFAKGKRKSKASRNKRIVAMAKKSTGDFHDYGYAEIAEEFDLGVNQISRICVDAGFRRHAIAR